MCQVKWLAVLWLCLFIGAAQGGAAEDYYRSGSKAGGRLEPQHSPLGFLGASGLFQVGRADIRVLVVDQGGIADRGGLRVGDVVTGASGKRFVAATDAIDDGGEGPREDLGMAMDASLQRVDRCLVLTVRRGAETKRLRLKLRGVRPLSPTYPSDCVRSNIMLYELSKRVLEHQRNDGGFGRGIHTATAGMGLLSTGQRRYRSAIKRAAYQLLEHRLQDERFPMWGYIYAGTFLCEYYLATGDAKVLPRIREISDTLVAKGTSPHGKHGHGLHARGGYGGSGLNIVSAHVLLVWALARQCGVVVDAQPYQATLAHLKRCTRKQGGTGYRAAQGMGDAAARTGLFALALAISGDDQELCAIQTGYLAEHTRRSRESHTNGLFGMIWATAALACADPDGYRTHMDYWRWYMQLGEAPKGHRLARFYIGSKRSNGGDGYLGWDKYNQMAMMMMLGSGKRRLFIHGNRQRNWYSG
jgi:hypothetical protein